MLLLLRILQVDKDLVDDSIPLFIENNLVVLKKKHVGGVGDEKNKISPWTLLLQFIVRGVIMNKLITLIIATFARKKLAGGFWWTPVR